MIYEFDRVEPFLAIREARERERGEQKKER